MLYFSAYIPRFEDIEKTEQNFLMETTSGKITGNENTDKVKVYKHENSDFVRIHDLSNNQQSIYRFEGNLVQPGRYRCLFPSGATIIGYRYLARQGGVDQYYDLYRYSSGDIDYVHQILRNNNWEIITQYKFDVKNLTWTKTV